MTAMREQQRTAAELRAAGPGKAMRRAHPNQAPATISEALPIFLRHGSPRILIATVLAALAVRAALGAPTALDLLPVVGLLAFWPFQEWLIHVVILHFRPRRIGRFPIDFRVPREHRAHHRDPWNYEILFIPIHSYLYSIPLMVGLWYVVAPSAELAWTGIAAHLALALHYEWIHFLIHTRVTPRTRLYRRLWQNHRLHHFRNEHYWFGVTRLDADWLLGTSPHANDVAVSPTATTLVGRAELDR